MTIVIKEIRVNTVVEKKVVQSYDIPEYVYEQIKEKVVMELSGQIKTASVSKKKER